VEHHAFGSLGHRSIGNLSARRGAFAHEMVEDLRGPDGWYVRGFAEPKHLFLILCKPLVADLDGEVAARDHDTKWYLAGTGNDDFR
jgi:hypothetical protein